MLEALLVRNIASPVLVALSIASAKPRHHELAHSAERMRA